MPKSLARKLDHDSDRLSLGIIPELPVKLMHHDSGLSEPSLALRLASGRHSRDSAGDRDSGPGRTQARRQP